MIERMNEKITIQNQTMTIDDYANHVRDWTDYFTCWAYASTQAKDEQPDVTTTDQRGITFEVRFCSELEPITSASYRVIFHDEIYDIQSVDMMNWMRKTIKLKCQKTTEKVPTNEQEDSNNGTGESGTGGTGELLGSGSGGNEQSG